MSHSKQLLSEYGITMTHRPGISQIQLTDNVAIVTGGLKGLSEVVAAGLASVTANLLLVSHNEHKAKATVARNVDELHNQL